MKSVPLMILVVAPVAGLAVKEKSATQKVTFTVEEVREAIEPIVTQIEETIRSTIERTPPELVRDIVDQGIVLSGGTANLRGLNIRFADALNVPIHIAEQPVYSVALGLGKILEMPQDKTRLSITVEKQGV